MKNPILVPKLAVLLHQTNWEALTIRINGKPTRVWRAFYKGLIAKDHPNSKESKNAERDSRGLAASVPGQEPVDTVTIGETGGLYSNDDQQDHQE